MITLDKLMAERLKYGRKLAGYTQEAMAEKLRALGVDISLDKIKSIESGRRSARNVEVVAYAVVCEREPGWFYDELPDNLAEALTSAIPGLLNDLVCALFPPRTASSPLPA